VDSAWNSKASPYRHILCGTREVWCARIGLFLHRPLPHLEFRTDHVRILSAVIAAVAAEEGRGGRSMPSYFLDVSLERRHFPPWALDKARIGSQNWDRYCLPSVREQGAAISAGVRARTEDQTTASPMPCPHARTFSGLTKRRMPPVHAGLVILTRVRLFCPTGPVTRRQIFGHTLPPRPAAPAAAQQEPAGCCFYICHPSLTQV
jgi:hypothetical protein